MCLFSLISAQQVMTDASLEARLRQTPLKQVPAPSASAACLYCRRMDKNSGFLVSYSYCQASDECLQDAWNYINRDCQSDWEGGKKYDLAVCNPDFITCPPTFVSSESRYGSYENMTWTLPEGSACNVVVDTGAGLARVIFDETSYLGLEGTDKNLGDVITYE